jgi:hypothetical protein
MALVEGNPVLHDGAPFINVAVYLRESTDE